MARLPATRLGKVEYFEAHLPAWELRASEIGVSGASVANLAALTAATRAAFLAAQEARNAAEAATQAYHRAAAAMSKAGVNILATIRVFASTTNDSGVLAVANVEPRAAASPLAAPGTPYKPSTTLLTGGRVRIAWKCDNPTGSEGTVYEIRRRIGEAGAWGPLVFIGTSGARAFTDETIPQGAGLVSYQITALRSTARGQPAEFTVQFGALHASGANGVRIAA